MNFNIASGQRTACALLLLCLGWCFQAVAQTLPLEIRQGITNLNMASTNGMPISDARGVPPGSDGRAPGAIPGPVGTANQFQGFISFGGLARPGTTNLTPGLSYAANAVSLNLPRSANGSVIMLRAIVGRPYLGQVVSFTFGSIIPPPDKDEYGVLLSATNPTINRPPTVPEAYWLREPFTTTSHTNYYWSPHAERVFATDPGPITIAWRKAALSVPPGPLPPDVSTNFVANGLYTVYTNRYFVSATASKEPRKIYWTEGSFTLGKPILVPADRVKGIEVAYNRNVPAVVTNEVVPSGLPIPVTNTIWFERQFQQIKAYNREGRVFVELLGDKRGESGPRDTHQHLGFEIVDIFQEPAPDDVTVELGELLTAYANDIPDDADLIPEPLLSADQSFSFRHSIAGTALFEFFATRETRNQNDYQVHWMEEGLQGLRWPFRFVRYRMVWPDDVTKYSHFIRPVVANEEEAKATAVQLPAENAPYINYQDPLDTPRGKLTESFAYYSFLTTNHPAHRALLRFVSGEYVRFERIFSWLDRNVRNTNQGFAGTVATNLSTWNPNTLVFNWTNGVARPRLTSSVVFVGDRITAPSGEQGALPETHYLAGFVRDSQGKSFHPGAYVNPFAGGFDLANQGAIIPVNSIPGQNVIEVWWFRRNQADVSRGFDHSFWPAVISRYTIQWPQNASEIILASDDGTGPLTSLEAKGRIYYENDSTRPGYNPNEEHALMQGGQAYALRDDLNITNGPAYSSQPFVLLEYTAEDGKTAIRPFKVRREKPEAGITFNYNKPAGSILQPPMPLPLLGAAFAPKIPGQSRRGLNEEIIAWAVTGSDNGSPNTWAWSLTNDAPSAFLPFWPLALQNPPATRWFYATNVAGVSLGGVISSNRPFALGLLQPPATQSADPNRWRFGITNAIAVGLNAQVLLARGGPGLSWLVTVRATNSQFVEVDFAAARPASATTNIADAVLVVPVTGANDGAFNGWKLAWNELPQTISTLDLYSSATVTDRKGNVWVYRGPHEPSRPETFTMRFYYNTLPGFYFPGAANQPPPGTATPYLRQIVNGQFVGDPVNASHYANSSANGNALGINYHPVWPDNVPVLQMAETLTTPKRGLPAVRGQNSVRVLYQQSQVSISNNAVVITADDESVMLHDPTREKEIEFDLASLPTSVRTETSRGLTFFPNLPPHLVDRFFFDPNRKTKGALVFKGEFVDAPLGEKYLLLNVAGMNDFRALADLCLSQDPRRSAWESTLAGLTAEIEKFVENPAQPGNFIRVPVGSAALGQAPRVEDDDVAVDSYALTATGPGVGYVTLMAGNGAATPEADPVSIHVIRVVKELYRGELNVIESSNPLNERLTLQQVVDLGGQAHDYKFEWRIAAPVDGLPPAVYTESPQLLTPNLTWSHVRYVLPSDTLLDIARTPASRVAQDVTDVVAPVSAIAFNNVAMDGDHYRVTLPPEPHRLAIGDRLAIADGVGTELFVTVHDVAMGTNQIVLSVDPGQSTAPFAAMEVLRLYERVTPALPQSVLFTSFTTPNDKTFTEVWFSLDLAQGLSGEVYLNGNPIVASDTLPASPPSDLASPRLPRYYRLPASALGGGQVGSSETTHTLIVALHSAALPGSFLTFKARVEAYEGVDQVVLPGTQWLALDPERFADGIRAVLGGSADVQSLSDNYIIMRYQARDPGHASYLANGNTNSSWSAWTEPMLAEGWIKRVLKGINPFNQRVTDLYNNAVNTDVSVLTQAGQRWEGDVALNLDSINNVGLIEIYETVLNRGKNISIGGGINYGPANDALLLAAGYLNDLYMLLGNEALADASNPTIGIGTKDNTYADIATALFSFKGQLPTLLDEELALLRGRDDSLLPGVEVRPVYNRMVWNYTRGIDAGEVVYALNYNVLDQNNDGRVDADDARRLYPQGHGDSYGHYLTAVKGYYGLLLDQDFDWVPRIEAVTILGKPVSVDYQDERKFAAAAGALARAGKQIFDLSWRKDYLSGGGNGWKHFAQTRSSNKRTRFWGVDHWASRTGQGAYINWVVGNAIIPEKDNDPTHQGTIQQVDRTTVPELKELPAVAQSLQTALDNAEGRLTPLGMPENSIPFDLNPLSVANGVNTAHFEQIYQRAMQALQNATVAFDDAKDVTRLMRSEQDSLADLRTAVQQEELAYTNALIELYGTPYAEDIGPGKTYRAGYLGPDLVHYAYVDNVELTFTGPQGTLLDPAADVTWKIDTQTFTGNWLDENGISDFNFVQRARTNNVDGTPALPPYESNTNLYVEYTLSSHGFFKKPANWTSRRASPGRIQQAISDIIKARNNAYQALYDADAAKYDLDWAIQSFERKRASHQKIRDWQTAMIVQDRIVAAAQMGYDIASRYVEQTKDQLTITEAGALSAVPQSFIAGLAAGGDLTSPIRAAFLAAFGTVKSVTAWSDVIAFSVFRALTYASETANQGIEFGQIAPEEWNQELREATTEIRDKVYGMNNVFMRINEALQQLDDAQREYASLIAEGLRIQQEREIFRQRTAAVIQGYRTRDAAFRIFRNEKLERYKTLFDMASQYAFMAAKAFDYDTGLLHTDQGKDFINRIVRARALGVIQDGKPQFGGSNTGDPGLSSALAEMLADWGVLSGRLGFKNPDAYGTTVSLRTENFRILPGTNGDVNWQEVLSQARKANILEDADVRRYCLQINSGNGLPVPGLIVEFSTTIADGLNLFGRPLAPGDHAFSASSFATKIFAMGVSLEGYIGMDDPVANGSAIEEGGGSSPADPDLTFLDPNAMAATPYVYLIPVGVDSMRSPPLGDQSVIRTWSVDDIAIPLPFNIGGSAYSTEALWQSADSLSEPLFTIRKHQAFRPVSSAAVFGTLVVYWTGGELERSQYTNTRLLGRSAWNSKWKIVIPGKTLLADPDEGIERFVRCVNDIKLYFHTYSYAGN